MSRKKAIIFSVTGIFVVTILLLGFTYGFFASIVSGNETAKKVTLKAGNSEVEYTDLSEEDIEQIIEPGFVNIKFFTVKNIGEVKASYYIFLTNVINDFIRKQDITYKLYRIEGDTSIEPEDVDITVTNFSNWEEVSYGQYPSQKASLITEPETIVEPGDYYVYAFRVEYYNHPTEDQADDMGHIFSGKIQISGDESGEVLDPFAEGTLAYTIIENARTTKNGTTFREEPLTVPLLENSSEFEAYVTTYEYYSRYSSSRYYIYSDSIDVSDGTYKLVNPQVTTSVDDLIGKYTESYSGNYNDPRDDSNYSQLLDEDYSHYSIYKIGDNTSSSNIEYAEVEIREVGSRESSLSLMDDVYGPSYYFRGNVQDNYLIFNKMCWRIVRIEGDGSIKMIYAGELEEDTTTCSEVGTTTGILFDVYGEPLVARYGNSGDYADYTEYKYDSDYEYIIDSGIGLKETLTSWFDEKFSSKTLRDKLKLDKWCFGKNSYKYNLDGDYEYYYISGKRLFVDKVLDLKCENEEFDEELFGQLTADEMILAGNTFGSNSNLNYLKSNAQNLSFHSLTVVKYWFDNDEIIAMNSSGQLQKDAYLFSDYNIRPVITLKSGTKATGEGTQFDPYIIE